MDTTEIKRRFKRYLPVPETNASLEAIHAVCEEAACQIVKRTPVGREQSLAITALEECMMWATAAVARPTPVLARGGVIDGKAVAQAAARQVGHAEPPAKPQV